MSCAIFAGERENLLWAIDIVLQTFTLKNMDLFDFIIKRR